MFFTLQIYPEGQFTNLFSYFSFIFLMQGAPNALKDDFINYFDFIVICNFQLSEEFDRITIVSFVK